jgi:hypothetical protein
VAAAQRAATLAAEPLLGGLAGMLSMLGLLARPGPLLGSEDEEYSEEDEEELGMDGPATAVTRGAANATHAAPSAAEARATLDQTSELGQAGAATAAAGPRQAQQPFVPAGRSPAEVAAAAAAPDMSRVDIRGLRSSRPGAQPAPPPRPPQPQQPPSQRELQPRHTARPELTAAANAIPAPPAPVGVPPTVPEAGPGEEFDANVALAMQVGAALQAPSLR